MNIYYIYKTLYTNINIQINTKAAWAKVTKTDIDKTQKGTKTKL